MRPSKIDIDRGVAIVSGVPHCLYDGAIMNHVIRFIIGGWGAVPVTVFNCPLCGSEGEIS